MTDRPPSSYGSMHSDHEDEEDDEFEEPPLKLPATRCGYIQQLDTRTQKRSGVSFRLVIIMINQIRANFSIKLLYVWKIDSFIVSDVRSNFNVIVVERRILCSPSLHLFDRKYS